MKDAINMQHAADLAYYAGLNSQEVSDALVERAHDQIVNALNNGDSLTVYVSPTRNGSVDLSDADEEVRTDHLFAIQRLLEDGNAEGAIKAAKQFIADAINATAERYSVARAEYLRECASERAAEDAACHAEYMEVR